MRKILAVTTGIIIIMIMILVHTFLGSIRQPDLALHLSLSDGS